MSSSLSFELTDKVVVVTGAGRGIGRAIALACAQHGANLALGSRTVAESEETAEACRALGRRAAAWSLDVSSVASISFRIVFPPLTFYRPVRRIASAASQ